MNNDRLLTEEERHSYVIESFQETGKTEEDLLIQAQDAKTERIVREKTLKEVASCMETQGLYGEFGLCVGLGKWDEFFQSLKSGRFPQ